MVIAVEIYAEKPVNIKEGTYFKTSLVVEGVVLDGSAGYDEYGFSSIITSEKRLAALGRSSLYSLGSFPAGMGPIEARPGKYLEIADGAGGIMLELDTNLILDPGVLSDLTGVRLVGRNGKKIDIPLCRPDLKVLWEGRGIYKVPLDGIFISRVLQLVS